MVYNATLCACSLASSKHVLYRLVIALGPAALMGAFAQRQGLCTCACAQKHTCWPAGLEHAGTRAHMHARAHKRVCRSAGLQHAGGSVAAVLSLLRVCRSAGMQHAGGSVAAVLSLLRVGRLLHLLPSLDSMAGAREALGVDIQQVCPHVCVFVMRACVLMCACVCVTRRAFVQRAAVGHRRRESSTGALPCVRCVKCERRVFSVCVCVRRCTQDLKLRA